MSSLPLPFTLRLPHPYLTTYHVHEVDHSDAPTRYGSKLLRIRHEPRTSGKSLTQKDGISPPEQLHSNVRFTDPVQDQRPDQLPAENINSFWGRSRRSPKSCIVWNEAQLPTLAQAWLIVYALFSLRSNLEYIRIQLVGFDSGNLAEQLKYTGLAVAHPAPEGKRFSSPEAFPQELVLLRSAFWQGAGSPFGVRPVWAPETNHLAGKELCSYPPAPTDYTITTKFPESRVHAFHPRRPQKPRPASVIYSRYIPHLDEHFSMVALDYNDEEHLGLFNKWQNDPFVAAGWNETGTLEEHRTYLRNLHEDSHVLTMLARFDDTFFAYYEVYWAKEDHMGVLCDAGDFDRGRHSLVGNTSFRGKHRVSAWWSSLMHYMWLDDPRTQMLVGEPKATNATVLSYDLLCGFNVTKLIDLGHKRSAAMKCSRERFFQICPLAYEGETNVAGTSIKLFAKL